MYFNYKDSNGNPVFFDSSRKPISYTNEGKKFSRDTNGIALGDIYDPEGNKIESFHYDNYKNIKTYDKYQKPYQKNKEGHVIIKEYDSKKGKIEFVKNKQPKLYDYYQIPYETDNNGFIVEYNEKGFKYKKDKFGNIITFDSNKK